MSDPNGPSGSLSDIGCGIIVAAFILAIAAYEIAKLFAPK